MVVWATVKFYLYGAIYTAWNGIMMNPHKNSQCGQRWHFVSCSSKSFPRIVTLLKPGTLVWLRIIPKFSIVRSKSFDPKKIWANSYSMVQFWIANCQLCDTKLHLILVQKNHWTVQSVLNITWTVKVRVDRPTIHKSFIENTYFSLHLKKDLSLRQRKRSYFSLLLHWFIMIKWI